MVRQTITCIQYESTMQSAYGLEGFVNIRTNDLLVVLSAFSFAHYV